MPHTDITVKEMGERIAANLRKARVKRGLSQTELAKKMRCTRRAIAYYEDGTRTRFEGLVMLMRAAGVLGLKVGDLIGPRP